MSLLEVSHLSRRFGGLRAVEDVSFSLEAGGINALIGPNGAGKTTLFNMIAGALLPSSGRIAFDGRDLTGMAPQLIARRGLIRTFQLTRLFADMSAEENVRVGFHLSLRGGVWAALARPPRYRAAERDAAREARELLDLVGLADRAHLPAGQLTYGQQRLLEVARALAARPKLLLLDEPAAGLDTRETEALGTLLETVRQR
ncbi:MAG: ATP-binding cassette domain-containing protein, partial [Acetobacteraceae bacterium]